MRTPSQRGSMVRYPAKPASILIVLYGRSALFAGFLGVALSAAYPATCGAAEPLARVPGSVDPLLRVTPIEPERIRPAPTPGLSVPAVAGTQTIVLRDRVSWPRMPGEKPLAPVGPAILHVPNRYFLRTTDRPVEMWELFLLLLYPSLEPYTGGQERCGKPWCGDELFINLTNGPLPSTHQQIASLENEVAHGGFRGGTSFETIAPPLGYDKAYIESFPQNPQSRREEFLIVNGGGVFRETVGDCLLDTPARFCGFYIDYPGNNLKIHYRIPMTYLSQRLDVENSIFELVGRFLLRTGVR